MRLPSGLTWRAEFAPQHAGGKEMPRAPGEARNESRQPDQNSTTDPKAKGNPDIPSCMDTNTMFMIAAMFFVIYFLMIRPGQKQEKQLKTMRSGLQMDDRVVTNSGMHGTILSVDEKARTVSLRTDEEGRVRMTFDTSAISRKVTDDQETTGQKNA